MLYSTRFPASQHPAEQLRRDIIKTDKWLAATDTVIRERHSHDLLSPFLKVGTLAPSHLWLLAPTSVGTLARNDDPVITRQLLKRGVKRCAVFARRAGLCPIATFDLCATRRPALMRSSWLGCSLHSSRLPRSVMPRLKGPKAVRTGQEGVARLRPPLSFCLEAVALASLMLFNGHLPG